jgi:predicted transcriptional regulator of viral defense system
LLNGGSGPKKRAEMLRTRGPSLRNRAIQLAQEKGVVTTRELQAIGVHRCYLSPMCKEGLLVRVGHGLYRAAPPKDQAA